MISSGELKDTIGLYIRHGWTLRRALFSAENEAALSDEDRSLLNGSEISRSSHDALWFSRRSQPGTETWELRRLSGTPFAMLQVFDDGTDPDEMKEQLEAVYNKMFGI